jgi:hypothetical protein
MDARAKSIDFDSIKTYPLRERENKVRKEEFARVTAPASSFESFLDSLPNILAAKDFRSLVRAILNARRNKKPVILSLGGHVVKCGLAPILIDLIQRGVITHLALNGSASIHDFEIALIGETSEEVATSIKDGTFGMADETGRFINQAMAYGIKQGFGAGKAVAQAILGGDFPHKDLSLQCKALEAGITTSIHIAIGTDIIHQHPVADGAVLGEATFKDFQLLTNVVSQMDGGGVFLNVGSAVLMPEIFLKAVSISRNLGFGLKDFVTANLDMIYHYRARENIITRPHINGNKGINIVGHHEIMVPLLARAIVESLD